VAGRVEFGSAGSCELVIIYDASVVRGEMRHDDMKVKVRGVRMEGEI
jgi:hypothetical protein